MISLASHLDGTAVISGHLDQSLHRFFFDDNVSGATQGKFADHPVPPTCLVWGEHVAVAGVDRTVTFYDQNGRVVQSFDYSREENQKEFTTGECSPSGQSLVFGSYDKYGFVKTR